MNARQLEFMAYAIARDGIEARLRAASARLNAIPGIGSGPMGLTPDSVKQSAEYREARATYDDLHKLLGRLNARNVKRFAPELRAEREAARAAKLAALDGGKGAPIAA